MFPHKAIASSSEDSEADTVMPGEVVRPVSWPSAIGDRHENRWTMMGLLPRPRGLNSSAVGSCGTANLQ